MATFRTPRGYGVNVVQYRELMEGQRPESSAIPMEAWTGLPPVMIEEIHHDPVVIMPGTFVGIATGGTASGKIFPAHAQTGNMAGFFSSTDDTWGLPTSNQTWAAATVTAGPVLPLGVVYQPIYSFNLQQQFINYKRNENMGILTDYLIQIPAITAAERLIQPGHMVMINTSATDYGRAASVTLDNLMGRLQKWDDSASTLKYVVGRCYGKVKFAGSGTAVAGTKLSADTASWTLTTAGKAELKGLDKVQTVPGLGLAGSGTKGVPGWLMDARSDASGNYYLLNILVRL